MQTSLAHSREALDAEAYDRQWRVIDDFILHHPGARHRRRLLFKLIAQTKASTLLDVGCGNGELLALIRQQFPSISMSGADLSPEVVSRNSTKYPQVEFNVLDIEKSSLKREFDLVVSSEVIEHLNNRFEALSHMGEMVKPGGHLLLSSPSGRLFETERRWGHTTHPTKDELLNFANKRGFEVKYLANWGFPLYYGLKFATNFNADWSMKNFGNGSYSFKQKLLCHALYLLNFLNLPNSPWGCQLVCLMHKPKN